MALLGRTCRIIFFLGGLLVGLLTGYFLGSLEIDRQRQLQAEQHLLLRSRVLDYVLEKNKADNLKNQHSVQTASSQSLPFSRNTVVPYQFRIRARSRDSNSLIPTSLIAVIVLDCDSHLLKEAEETWASDISVLPVAPFQCKSTLQSSTRIEFIETPDITNSNGEFYYAVLDFLYKNKFYVHHDWFIVTPVSVYLNSENVNRFIAGLNPTERHYIALTSSFQFGRTPLLLSQSVLKEIAELRKQATESYKPTELKAQYYSEYNLWINGEQLFDTVMVQPISASNNAYSIHLFFKLMKYRKLKNEVMHLNIVLAQLLDRITRSDQHNNLTTSFHARNQPAYIRTWAYFNRQFLWYSDQRTYPGTKMYMYTFVQHEGEMALFEAYRAAKKITGKKLSWKDFTDGYVRHDALNGNEYIIRFFQKAYDERIHLSRPFSHYTVNQVIPLSNEKVHFVVPISNGIERLALFLRNYEQEFLTRNENTSLTLAVYGDTTMITNVKEMIRKLVNKYIVAADITVITGRGKFSRGRALNAAIRNLRKDNLVYICDVDLILDTDFIGRCRSNTERGKKVYYPEFFKLYNEKYMFRPSPEDISDAHKPSIKRQTGHWAYYSYGMVCIYKSDFDAIGGFNQKLEGWGGEDVQLINKILAHKELEVFRAPDTGLMHRWHKKVCKTTDNQYKDCLASKSENLADNVDLARLALIIEEVCD